MTLLGVEDDGDEGALWLCRRRLFPNPGLSLSWLLEKL
jgi:hypothetical protein